MPLLYVLNYWLQQLVSAAEVVIVAVVVVVVAAAAPSNHNISHPPMAWGATKEK